MSYFTPNGMSRRHFMRHMATAATTIPTLQFLNHLQANAAEVRRNQKSCILMWMGGGPPTIDIWDLKPGSKNGGESRPIDTAASGVQISEHLPETAKVFKDLSIIRSMSTREADHTRGRYYMHTGFVPNPTVVHPTFGSVVSYELGQKRTDLEIPSFISIGTASGSAGFLGMTHAPFVVDSSGNIQNGSPSDDARRRLPGRLTMLDMIETSFVKSNRGELPAAHRDVYKNAVNLMVSEQMKRFRIDEEPADIQAKYGAPQNRFGQSLLMARRLAEIGVPFIEVGVPGGWDLHNNVFATLKDNNLPPFDQGLSALVTDLKERGMLDHTVLVCMGEFGRTPRINQDVGRDHWATSWSLMIGGGGLNNGQAVGETDADGLSIVGKSYLPGDVWATVSQALGIPINTVHTSKRGRPMKLANGGTPIKELIG